MTLTRAVIAALMLAAPVAAHEPTALELEPNESVLVTCDFAQRNAAAPGATCATPGAIVVTVRKGTDATPAGIVTSGPTAAGANLTMRIAPGGSRHGTDYQVHAPCTFSNGDILACNFVVRVARVTVR